jgi:hypothetical protein
MTEIKKKSSLFCKAFDMYLFNYSTGVFVRFSKRPNKFKKKEGTYRPHLVAICRIYAAFQKRSFLLQFLPPRVQFISSVFETRPRCFVFVFCFLFCNTLISRPPRPACIWSVQRDAPRGAKEGVFGKRRVSGK